MTGSNPNDSNPTNPAKNFSSETNDDCTDDARTAQNREGVHTTDDAQDNAEQRSRETESDRPPTRDAGTPNNA